MERGRKGVGTIGIEKNRGNEMGKNKRRGIRERERTHSRARENRMEWGEREREETKTTTAKDIPAKHPKHSNHTDENKRQPENPIQLLHSPHTTNGQSKGVTKYRKHNHTNRCIGIQHRR